MTEINRLLRSIQVGSRRSINSCSAVFSVLARRLKSARQARFSLAPGILVTSLLGAFFVSSGRAQNSQFTFDLNGNLAVQTTASSALPQIISQPQQQVVAFATSASFIVVAANTLNLTYQWRFNGGNINGATGDALLVTNVSVADVGQYTVVLANSSGSVTSAPAALLLDSDNDGLADSWEQTYFGGLVQNATGDYDGDGVSNLNEFLDGTNPTNSASALFRLNILSDGGQVTYTPTKLTYTNGEVVTLAATAFAPEVFHGWTGDLISRTNPETIVMTSNKTVVANFRARSIVWTNVVNGSWHNPLNWYPNLVPTILDDVSISTGFTITVNEPAQCHQFTFSGSGILTGTNTLTLYGDSFLLGGTMNGGGRTIVAAGATLSFPNSSFTLNARTLENAGTVRLTGGSTLGLFNNSVFTNLPGALFHAQNAAALGGDGSRFDNAGILRKSVDTGTTTFNGVVLNNYGAVDIQTGTLSLSGGGSNSGVIDIAAGTTLNFAAGTFNSGASGTIEGAGQLMVSGTATANLGGVVNVSGTNSFSGSAANLTGNYICTNNTLLISFGTTTFNATGTLNPTVVNMISGILGGSQTLTVGSTMTWNNGTMNGGGRTVIPVGAVLNIPSAGPTLNSRVLENAGTVLLTGSATLGLSGGSVFTNLPGALFHAQNAAALGGDGSRFDNAGILRKSVDTGTTTFNGVVLNNYGAVDIQTGTLSLSGGGSNSGVIDIATGTTLNFSGGGTFSSGASGTIEGPGQLMVSGTTTVNLGGTVNVSGTNSFNSGTANLTGTYICTNNMMVIAGGTANFNGTGVVNPSVLTMTSGLLGGSQTVTVGNTMTWNGGVMIGGGRTLIPVTATLIISNAGVTLNPRALENAGTTMLSGGGGLNIFGGSVFTNLPGGLFLAQNANSFVGDGSRFDNAGIFRKSGNTGTTTFNGVPFNNYGTVDIRNGIIAANSSYTSSANALLSCALGGTTAGTGYGKLQIANAVTLNGTLSVDFTNGYSPAVNDSFTLVSAGTRSGAFANFLYPSNVVTMQLSNAPSAVIARVTGLTTVPVPMLLPPAITNGTNILLTWTSVSNVSYRLEYNAYTTQSNWAPVPGGDVTAVNTNASKSDPVTSSNRFYRVRVLP